MANKSKSKKKTNKPVQSTTTYTYVASNGEKASDNIGNTRRWARMLHGKQTDKSGEPYVNHLDAVAFGVWQMTGDVELVMAAYLHDVVEDTGAILADLPKSGYSERVVKVVDALTKKYNENNFDYVTRVIEAGPDAMFVKLSDLRHNTRADRLAGVQEDVQKRLLKKYYPAIWRIEGALVAAGKMGEAERTITFEQARKAAEYEVPRTPHKGSSSTTMGKPSPSSNTAPEGKSGGVPVKFDYPFEVGNEIKYSAVNGRVRTIKEVGEVNSGSVGRQRTIRFTDNGSIIFTPSSKVWLLSDDKDAPGATKTLTVAPAGSPEKQSVETTDGWRRPGKEQNWVPVSQNALFRRKDSEEVKTVKSAKTAKNEDGLECKHITFTDDSTVVLVPMKSQYEYKYQTGYQSGKYRPSNWKDYMGLPQEWKDGDPVPGVKNFLQRPGESPGEE